MVTRNTKTKGTNRQHDIATPGNAPEWIRGAKYDRFSFAPEWLEYIDSLPRIDGGRLLMQIRFYAFFETEPENLTPETQEYFNKEIRPELDRQHKRLNEGKRI